MTEAQFRAEVAKANDIKWPCQYALRIPDNTTIELSEPVVFDCGPLLNPDGSVRQHTRGPGPMLIGMGVQFHLKDSYDWTDQAAFEFCGAPSHLDGFVIRAANLRHPPAAAIAGGLVDTGNGGNSYTGGTGSMLRLFIEGVFTKSAVIRNNHEMDHIELCNILNKHPNGYGVAYYRGGTMMQYRSRISDRGHTQTNCTLTKSRVQSQNGAAVYGWGNVQNLTVSDNIIQTQSGLAWLSEGGKASNVNIERNRHETEVGLAMCGWEHEPEACRVSGNYVTQHGANKPAKMWLNVCPTDQVEADSIRLRENASSTRLIDHRQTMPVSGSTGV